MAAVSLWSKVLGRKINKFGAIFVKHVLWGMLGEAVAPSAPPLITTPMFQRF